MAALDAIRHYLPELTRLRQDLHAHPEIGFEEHRTAAIVADELRRLGIEVHREIGGTGVVGVLQAGDSGRAVGLRADMDALPMQEENTFPHASRHKGRMHACGHDGHTAMLLGAARYLAETRDFSGTVNFIFQPAEEGLGGASAMIEDGLFDRFPCQSVFGMHNSPGLPVGRFALRPGVMMAGGSFFDILVRGRGSHGARPNLGIDPVLTACHIATALQSIVSRNVDPLESAVVSLTGIQAGDAYNVIPEQVVIRGTARSFSHEAMQLIEDRMRRMVGQMAAAFGASADLDFRRLFVPLSNDAAETAILAAAAAAVAGPDRVNTEGGLTMASEDFAYMLAARPGAYIRIGNGDTAPVHNPRFDFNDAAIPYGAAVFAMLIESKLPSGLNR